MKPDPLDAKLAAYAKQPVPSGPGDLHADVWKEIARRRSQSFWTRILPVLEWRELFAEPRLAVPAFAFAVLAGVFPAVVLAKTHEEQRLVRQSIHFNVFSTATAKQLASLSPAGSTHSLRP
jgi:hypothetical protein